MGATCHLSHLEWSLFLVLLHRDERVDDSMEDAVVDRMTTVVPVTHRDN